MSDDAIAAFVFGAILLVPFGLFAFYWRQRLRFTHGAEPVVACSVRWWNGPVGLGWRQGFVKLDKEQLTWRRRLSFRTVPDLTLQRSGLSLLNRSRPDWQAWLWISSFDVLTLTTSNRRLELALQPDDADVFLDWLGTPVERPKKRLDRRVRLAIWALWIVGLPVLYVLVTGRTSLVMGIVIVTAVVGGVGGIVLGTIRRSRLLSQAQSDDFVASTSEVFAFLQDFGFDGVYVQHFPWRTSVAFTGSADRVVAVTIDRREESLDMEIGRRSGTAPARRLRDILVATGHPDPDRVTRYTGVDGPLLSALDANSHALRLWGRAFLSGATEPVELLD